MSRIYVGHLKKLEQTEGAVIITQQGLELNGRSDRKIYLPKSQIQIKRDNLHGWKIYIPDWIIIKSHINWNRIEEIDPIDPPRSKILINKGE